MVLAKETPKALTPEEKELVIKRADLEKLEIEFCAAELELKTLKNELQQFEQDYATEIIPAFLRLDNFKADIAAVIANYRPIEQVEGFLWEKQDRAKTTQQSADCAKGRRNDKRSKTSAEVRKLYREAAKLVHPDLMDSNTQKDLGHKKMIELNEALALNDATKIKQIIAEWQSENGAANESDGTGAELVKLIRKIAYVRERIDAVAEESNQLTKSALYDLWITATKDDDVLPKMRVAISGHVERLLDELIELLNAEPQARHHN